MATISKRGAGKSNAPPYDESIIGWIKKYLKIYESGYYDSATLSRMQLVKNYELVQLLDKQLDWLVKFYKVNKNELSREALLEIASEISIIINKVEDINNGRY